MFTSFDASSTGWIIIQVLCCGVTITHSKKARPLLLIWFSLISIWKCIVESGLIKQRSMGYEVPTTSHSLYYYNCLLQRCPTQSTHLKLPPCNILGQGKRQVTRDKKHTHTITYNTILYCVVKWYITFAIPRQQGNPSNSTAKSEPAWSRWFAPHSNLLVNCPRRSPHYSIQSHEETKN